jgi:hypothetical protein
MAQHALSKEEDDHIKKQVQIIVLRNEDSSIVLGDKLEERLKERGRLPILKGCFIATAAMGSDLHPHVSYLRRFRDNIVLRSRYTEAFEKILDIYYKFSPPIAGSIKRRGALQLVVRLTVVYPLIFFLKEFVRVFNYVSQMKEDAKTVTKG